ncbi:DNA repair protein RadA [Boudabousia tangfeifanii]|uniref:DNA repair protein RadA n=1 Tax=Boudabousia tangfeifanii TaxID=1912795 RepID=A0A1D9MLK1_9ACTO|nr:DNA repair protein RadA [Boudabousia tangfeifanii]AOZ73177.1 DNA repair protein RadA [Boudabousia tangfeifanii]
MAKAKTIHECSECGATYGKWQGQCRNCGEWNTITEVTPSAGTKTLTVLSPGKSAKPITEVDSRLSTRRKTGVGELDRVLGGGFVPGAVVLLTGEPGIGKSTLLLDVSAKVAAKASAPVLYVTGEESASQVRLRAERIGALHDNLLLAAETNLAAVLGHIEENRPSLLIVDSVQTLAHPEVEGSAGGVAQVRAVASLLIAEAKSRSLPVILVGHVTKDGTVAGPRVLEHLVDVVAHFEGDRHARLRLLRAIKNRYGATDEVGCFEMSDLGIVGLEDPSGLFLESADASIPGTCVTVTLEGRRPLATQVQSLIASAPAGAPRRTTIGVDRSRVSMILAVLEARQGLAIAGRDVYVSTVGGAKTSEPAADLAVALSLSSAATNLALKDSLVAFGEIGLTGEVRATPAIARRLAEAERLGFKRAIVPQAAADEARGVKNLQVTLVRTLAEALQAAFNPSEK